MHGPPVRVLSNLRWQTCVESFINSISTPSPTSQAPAPGVSKAPPAAAAAVRWQALDAAGITPTSAALAAEDLSDPPQPGPKVITATTLTTDGLQFWASSTEVR